MPPRTRSWGRHSSASRTAQSKTANGEPVYASSGIPTTTTYPELSVAQPDVYYGEGERGMAFVNLRRLQENDHATGQGLIRSTYPVRNGVSLNGAPVTRAQVRPGDVLVIGPVTFTIERA